MPLAPCRYWHQSPAARRALADLGRDDVRLAADRSAPGPHRLVWYPASDHGSALFAVLTHLRQQAIGPAFALARNAPARAAALAAAQQAPTVEAAVGTRFGDADRWLGFGPLEATRRFRAHWTDC